MTTKSKKKKHALNPIIILSFIVIGLLFVILTIAMKENININGNLKASAYYCKPNSEVKRVPGNDYVVFSAVAPIEPSTLKEMRADAAADLKTQFCANQMVKDENQIPCTDQKCESKPSTEKNPNPRCDATITSLKHEIKPPNPSPGVIVTITWTATLNAELRRSCVPKVVFTTTPLPFPQCIPSGSLSTKCSPKSEGIFKVENTMTATNTDGISTPDRTNKATREAVRLATEGLEAKCAALATNDPMYKCTDILHLEKGCSSGCKPNLKSVYNAPYIPLTRSGVGQGTVADCTTTSVAFTSNSVTMKATCYAACTYKQDCVPHETPPPPVSDPFTDPRPVH